MNSRDQIQSGKLTATPPAPVTGENSALVNLVDGLIACDSDSWRELISLIGPIAGSICRKVGLSDDETDDVTQAVVIKLLENNSRSLRGLEITTKHAFFGWLKVVISRTVLDYVRGTKTLHEYEFTSGKAEWVKAVRSCPQHEIESMTFVEQTVSQLPEEDQVLFWLDFRDLKGKEIATLLGLPLNTVHARMSRLKKKLKAILKIE